MNQVQLNLARKWRSKQFNEIVGQSLAVRVLQNSLYLQQFFPVYLFAGQRGCGKTSTARVFAAAVNCTALPDFSKNPKQIVVPCLVCDSCVAMMQGKHPDFIEIDAASYTGVDNVRNIIDNSTSMPLLGTKKIYLIDEAHMLSKSAFNAFLKILEEPPMSVIFILATTEMHKILDTVRSRCFQVFFDAVKPDVVQQHLLAMCQKEQIAHTPEGLLVIAQETQGSLRDAINLLERVRFAHAQVSKEAVLGMLGHISDELLLLLMGAIVTRNQEQFLEICTEIEHKALSVEHVWQQAIACLYDIILQLYGAPTKTFAAEVLQPLAQHATLETALFWFELLLEKEAMLGKVTKKNLYFEMLIMQYWHVASDAILVDKKKS